MRRKAPFGESVKLKNCPICGKAFAATPSMRVCRDCREKEIEMEVTVVRYVREHPKCKIKEILEETGASESLVRRMIQEGYFTQIADLRYPCEKCGKMITMGKYCKQCVEKMKADLQRTKISVKANADRSKRTYSEGLTQKVDALAKKLKEKI